MNCKACSDIRSYAPVVADNGITEEVEKSLMNDTGFNPNLTKLHTDCEDMKDLNDCLIHNLKNEIDGYDVCTWKDFTKNKLVKRLYEMFKGINASLCGLWCKIKGISGGYTIQIGEDEMDMGIGVTLRGDEQHRYPTLQIVGSSWRFEGGFAIDATNNPAHWGKLGLAEDGSAISGHILNTPSGNWTLCIVRIKKSTNKQIRNLYSGVGSFVDASMGNVRVSFYNEGETYYGPWGEESGTRTVPAGYIYARISVSGVTTWGYETTGTKNIAVSASGTARTNLDNIEC